MRLGVGAGWILTTLVGAAGPALAGADCGPPVAGAAVCDGSGNPYAAGVAYDVAGALTLTLTGQAHVEGPIRAKADQLSVVNDGTIATLASGPALALSGARGVALRSAGAIASEGGSAPAVTIDSDGPVVVRANQITTRGWRSAGVMVLGGQAVDLQLDQVRVEGELSQAVMVETKGDVRVRADRLLAGGQNAQALVITGGAVDVGLGEVTITDGLRRGIDIQALGPVAIALGTVRASGGVLDAVSVHSDGGDVTLTADRVETLGANSRPIGVSAPNAFASVIVDTITTDGDDSMGLYVRGANARAVVTGTVSTMGQRRDLTTADGVQLQALGRTDAEGDATAVINNIRAVGQDARALLVDATRRASIQIRGDISAPLGEALRLTAADADVGIAQGAGLSGQVGVTAAVTGVVRLVNAGSIVAGEAIRATGPGTFVVDNRGVLQGRVTLGGGSDTIFNSGLAVVAGDWSLGGGFDLIDNTGVLRPTAVETRITELEIFRNGGLIDLTGAAGTRRLRLDGAFEGRPGGRLAVDLAATGGDGAADQLTILGLASGRTELVVNHLTGSLGLLGQALIVSVGVGSAADAFVLAPATPRGVFVAEALVFDPGASRFVMRGLPSNRALQVVAAAGLDEAIWLADARDFWARRASGISSSASGWSGWLEGSRPGLRATTRVDYAAFGAEASRSFDLDGPRSRLSGGIERLSIGRTSHRLAMTGTAWRQGRAAGWSLAFEAGWRTDAAFVDLAVGARAGPIRSATFDGHIYRSRQVSPTVQVIGGRYLRGRAITLIPWVGATGAGVSGARAVAVDGALAIKARTLAAAGAGLRIELGRDFEQARLRPFAEVSAVRRLSSDVQATLSDSHARVDLDAALDRDGLGARGGLAWRPTPRVSATLECAYGGTPRLRTVSASLAVRF